MGELRALRWRDVDFAKQTIHVRGSYTRGHHGPPKSGKVRSVPLIDQAARALGRLELARAFHRAGRFRVLLATGDHVEENRMRGRLLRRVGAKKKSSFLSLIFSYLPSTPTDI